jgi:hypothetical protein
MDSEESATAPRSPSSHIGLISLRWHKHTALRHVQFFLPAPGVDKCNVAMFLVFPSLFEEFSREADCYKTLTGTQKQTWLQVGFWVPRGRDYEERYLLECDTLLPGASSLTFRRNLLPPSSVSKNKANQWTANRKLNRNLSFHNGGMKCGPVQSGRYLPHLFPKQERVIKDEIRIKQWLCHGP